MEYFIFFYRNGFCEEGYFFVFYWICGGIYYFFILNFDKFNYILVIWFIQGVVFIFELEVVIMVKCEVFYVSQYFIEVYFDFMDKCYISKVQIIFFVYIVVKR